MKIPYRLRQFINAVTGYPSSRDIGMVRNVLSPELYVHFSQMQKSEQTHSIQICKDLKSNGEENKDLLTAALMHDVGKNRYPLSLSQRVLIVICSKIFPKKVDKWGTRELKGWNKPFVVAKQHPVWGAEIAQNAGASETVVNLIRKHQEKDIGGDASQDSSKEDLLLIKLQELDSSR